MRTADGLLLFFTEYGPRDAPLTIFLAHCWTLNQEDWHYQVQALQQEFGHRVRVVTWDHRGHGRSEACAKTACTIENLARDQAALIEELAPSGPLLLAGHSIGGMTMLALAEQRPELFERVVGAAFIATSAGDMDSVTLGLPEAGKLLRTQIPRILGLRSRTLSWGARRRTPVIERQVVRRFLFGKPTRLTDSALTVDGIISSPSATVVGFYEDCMRHRRYKALKVFDGIPTAVLVGSRDVLTPPSHSRRIAAGIEGAELTIAPEAGHMLPLERDALVSGVLIRLAHPHVRPR